MAAMPFVQVQRFILVEKYFGVRCTLTEFFLSASTCCPK